MPPSKKVRFRPVVFTGRVRSFKNGDFCDRCSVGCASRMACPHGPMRDLEPQRPTSMQVAIRIRPRLTAAELAEPSAVSCQGACEVHLRTDLAVHSFACDSALDEGSGQDAVWHAVGAPALAATLDGYNSSILAYGQTGAGKTHTMVGTGTAEGIIPRAAAALFGHDGRSAPGVCVRAAFLQLYNEHVCDLLRPERANLAIRESIQRGVYVEGLSEVVVSSAVEVLALLQRGHAARATAATHANELSSRSHAIFILRLEHPHQHPHPHPHPPHSAKLCLVDLAGSESARGGVSGQYLEECKRINQSLSALANVIHALSRAPCALDARGGLAPSWAPAWGVPSSCAARKAAAGTAHAGPLSPGGTPFGVAAAHVPYRDSKLTQP